MITRYRDSVANLLHNRDGGRHSYGTLEAQPLQSYRPIDLSRETHHSRIFRVRAEM